MSLQWLIVGWVLSLSMLAIGYGIAVVYYDDEKEPDDRRGRPVGEVPD